jgi:hypothetical protein
LSEQDAKSSYVFGQITERPESFALVVRGVFNCETPLLYRVATDIAAEYQSLVTKSYYL